MLSASLRRWTVGFSLLLSGCHIVERASQCAELANTLNRAEPELAPRLPSDPAPGALNHKAQVYRSLAHDLKKLPADDKTVSQERNVVSKHLSTIAEKLEIAAKAVQEDRARNQRLEQRTKAQAELRRKRAQKEARLERAGMGGAPPTARARTPPNEDRSKPKGKGSEASRGLGAKVPPKDDVADRRSSSLYSGRYQRAKTAIEAEAKRLNESLEQLQNACR